MIEFSTDNLPYEKVGKNEPVCIVDQIPFEIPESWEWVRLTTLGEIVGGGTPKTNIPEYWDKGNIPWLTPADMKFVTGKYVDKGERCITEEGLKGSSAHMMPAGTIVYSSRAPIGYIAIASTELCTNQGFKSLVPVLTCIDDYVYYCLIAFTPEIQSRASGTTFKEISGTEFGKTLIPLPPLAEQQRIVKRIEDVLPALKMYDTKETALHKMNGDFPDQLRKSILQWAVQGKLVHQDPTDEPASILLERIRAEKQQLVKEGKIKKDKHESVIFRRDNSHYEKLDGTEYCIDNELPFEIPENWCWVRLRSIVYNRGQATPNTAFCYIDIGSIDNKNQKLNAAETIIFPDKAPSRARKLVDKGDILYSTVRPYLHNMCIIDREFSQVPIASTGFAVLACHTGLLNKFLFYYMMSPDFDAYANNTDNAKGVAYPAISDARLYKALIPLPPFSEQQRIIQRIDELLPLVKGL